MKQLLIALAISSLSGTVLSEDIKNLMNNQGTVIGYVTPTQILNLDRRPIATIKDKHYVVWMHHKTYDSILAKDNYLYNLDGDIMAKVGE